MRIDAGGKQCPIPVIMAKKELEAGKQDVEIIVDGPTQIGNLTRLGDALGRPATNEPFGDKFLVKFANGETKITRTRSERTRESSDRTSRRWLSSHSANPRTSLHMFSS